MEQKVQALIQKYEEELKTIDEEECYDCCDYTSVGMSRAYVRDFLKELQSVL